MVLRCPILSSVLKDSNIIYYIQTSQSIYLSMITDVGTILCPELYYSLELRS